MSGKWSPAADAGTGVDTRRAAVGPALAVTISGFLANGLSYVVLLVGAARLVRADYSQLVAVLGVLVVASVPAIAIQTVAARRFATDRPAGVVRAAAIAAAGATLLLAAAAVPVARFVNMSSPRALVVVAATLPALTAIGLVQGMHQGRREFTTLARVFAIAAVARSGSGLLGLVLGRSTLACVGAIFVATTALGVWLLVRADGLSAAGGGGATTVLSETARAAHAHGAVYLLSTLDLLLAQHVLAPTQAAIYSSGAVIARAALWLPQSVATLAFPTLVVVARRRTVLPAAVGIVLAAGAVLIGGTLALPDLAARVIGSGRYPALADSAWAFAVLGTGLAVVQLTVVAGLAVRRLAPVGATWCAVAVESVLVLGFASPASVLGVVTVAAATVAGSAGIALALAMRGTPIRSAAGGTPDSESPPARP